MDGRKSQEKLPEFGVGTLMQIVPRVCHVSKCQASDCLHCNSVKIHLQRPPNHHFRQKIQLFFWQGHGQKYRSEFTKTCHFQWKIYIFFLGRGHKPFPDSSRQGGCPRYLKTPPLPLTKPGSAPSSPRIPARFTPQWGRIYELMFLCPLLHFKLNFVINFWKEHVRW